MHMHINAATIQEYTDLGLDVPAQNSIDDLANSLLGVRMTRYFALLTKHPKRVNNSYDLALANLILDHSAGSVVTDPDFLGNEFPDGLMEQFCAEGEFEEERRLVAAAAKGDEGGSDGKDVGRGGGWAGGEEGQCDAPANDPPANDPPANDAADLDDDATVDGDDYVDEEPRVNGDTQGVTDAESNDRPGTCVVARASDETKAVGGDDSDSEVDAEENLNWLRRRGRMTV